MSTSSADGGGGDEAVLARTQRWLERAVVGLNLCPFAKAVMVKRQIRWVVSHATSTQALLEELALELQFLAASDPEQVETTLLIHPHMLEDFREYLDFIDLAEDAVAELGLEGELQVASFHPQYQFAGSRPDDIENYSNRSPYPMLHLLREASISRAVEAFPDAAVIYETNMETLRRLGHAGWRQLWVEDEAGKPADDVPRGGKHRE
jgi:hypothetical protein